MTDPVRFDYESTPALWRCSYDPEGPSGFGKTKDEALFDLWLSCDGKEEPLMKAIVAAIPCNKSGGGYNGWEMIQRGNLQYLWRCPKCKREVWGKSPAPCECEPTQPHDSGHSELVKRMRACLPHNPQMDSGYEAMLREAADALSQQNERGGGVFQCCGAADPPCASFAVSCKNPANYHPALDVARSIAAQAHAEVKQLGRWLPISPEQLDALDKALGETPLPSRLHGVLTWRKWPECKPDPDGDSRHLVVIVSGDMHHVGVAAYVPSRGWMQNASHVEEGGNTFVWAFAPLPGGYPIPPNSAIQARLGCFAMAEPYKTQAREAMAEWWQNSARWTNGRVPMLPVEPLQPHTQSGSPCAHEFAARYVREYGETVERRVCVKCDAREANVRAESRGRNGT